jgi:glycosyltransferase involved in cell wall biosynthesis
VAVIKIMKSVEKLTIGLESRLFAGAMTGIGNYCFHLLRALMTDYPELSFVGFDWRSWKRLDAAALCEIENSSPSLEPDRGRLKNAIHRIKKKGRTRLTRVPLAQAFYRSRFSRLASQQSLDLFHAFNYLPVADPGATTLPVVYDLSFIRFPQFHPRDRLRVLDRLPVILAGSPLVQTISEFSRNEIATFYGYDRKKIFIAPPAAASIFRPLGAAFTRTDLDVFGVAPKRFFLAVGTLEPRKNLKTLVSAYGRLPKTLRNRTPLLVVGGAGWGKLNLPAETAKLVNEGSIRFLGSITNAQLRSLYEGAIALLFPSIYEGFGMPVVEAMACGTDVVHSMNTSMDEITNGLATRIEAMDVPAWSDAMTAIIETFDPSNSEQLVEQAATYSWNRTATIVRNAYAHLASVQ